MDVRWTFSDNRLSLTGNAQEFGICPCCTIEVSDGEGANWIDQQYLGNSSKFAGFYKLEDKKLVIYSELQPGVKNHPKKFSAEAGPGNSLIVLERVK